MSGKRPHSPVEPASSRHADSARAAGWDGGNVVRLPAGRRRPAALDRTGARPADVILFTGVQIVRDGGDSSQGGSSFGS